MATVPTPERGHVVIPRWAQLALVPALLIIGWFVLGAIVDVIFIFVTAGLVALVLNPLVQILERMRIPRWVGVFVVYFGFLAILALIGFLLWPPLVTQFRRLMVAIPGFSLEASQTIARLQHLADQLHLKLNVRQEVQHVLQSVVSVLPSLSRGVISLGVSVVRPIATLAVIIVASIYMLLDAKRLREVVAGHFPTRSRADGLEYAAGAQRAVVGYVKAQLVLSLALFLMVTITMYALSLTGVFPGGGRYALVFGAWAGLTEAIPYLGPWLAVVPPFVVAAFESWWAALWVFLIFAVLQQIEGHVLVPVVMGSRFRVHPLIVMAAILIGAEVHGLAGMLIAIPLIPLVKETIVFFRPRVSFQSWRTEACTIVEEATDTPPAGPPDPAGSASHEAPPA